MKTKLLFLLLFCMGLLNAQYTWQPLANAPKSWRLDDMYFLNPQKGWAINPYYSFLSPNQYGAVFTTNNGGQSWEKIFDSSQTFIRCVGFADSLNGWFGNLADTTVYNGHAFTTDTMPLYSTHDGGHTWAPVTHIAGAQPKGVCGISVISDSVIYGYGRYFGPAVFIKTTDKGSTWQAQDLSAYANGLVDAYFFNRDTGFIVGSYSAQKKALVLSTFDGGNTWQVRHQSTRISETGWKIVFPSRNVGYATIEYQGQLASYTSYVLKTIDGGLTWSELPVTNNYGLQGLGFINDSVGWAGGSCCVDANYKTINGGSSWTVDTGFGVQTPPYDNYGGFAMNRFRKFGDTLMYAAGNTVYKLHAPTTPMNVDAGLVRTAVKVYPNPFSVQCTLQFEKPLADGTIILYNGIGQVVLEMKNLKGGTVYISKSNLEPGLYFAQLHEQGRVYAPVKMVIQ